MAARAAHQFPPNRRCDEPTTAPVRLTRAGLLSQHFAPARLIRDDDKTSSIRRKANIITPRDGLRKREDLVCPSSIPDSNSATHLVRRPVGASLVLLSWRRCRRLRQARGR